MSVRAQKGLTTLIHSHKSPEFSQHRPLLSRLCLLACLPFFLPKVLFFVRVCTCLIPYKRLQKFCCNGFVFSELMNVVTLAPQPYTLRVLPMHFKFFFSSLFFVFVFLTFYYIRAACCCVTPMQVKSRQSSSNKRAHHIRTRSVLSVFSVSLAHNQ